MMVADELFGELPEQAKPQSDAAPRRTPRLREPQRDQIELRAVDLESLIGEVHPVRVIWALRRASASTRRYGHRPNACEI
jgi:hypothetical protein